MIEDDVQTQPDSTETRTEVEKTKVTARGKRPGPKKVATGKIASKVQESDKPKVRGLSEAEKLEKIRQIEAAVAGGGNPKRCRGHGFDIRSDLLHMEKSPRCTDAWDVVQPSCC
ncbi:hypothetical protein [Rhizobium leguminosarum]